MWHLYQSAGEMLYIYGIMHVHDAVFLLEWMNDDLDLNTLAIL